MEFSSKNFYLLGLISCFLNLVADIECHSIVKRNAWQLCNLMHLYTGRSCISYSPYGCFCGFGQAGTQPIDRADSCCKKHDDCYGEVTDRNRCSFWSQIVGYKYECLGKECTCTDDPERGGCSRAVCECDVKLAQCLSDSVYNRDLKSYDRKKCV